MVDLPADKQQLALSAAPESAATLHQVAAMLAADKRDGILDQTPPTFQDMQSDPFVSLVAGDRVGGFTIDRYLGRGGMGEVYLAHRTSSDFVQRVAVKLLRTEAAGRGQLFARERRLLAGLSHPNIARLIDGGVTDEGRPFMVMDYIDGQPIDIWVRENRADLATRLSLFRDICGAAAYAHANLVVHRDLKPSNIMIDRDGSVRLLDFGIAKLMDDDVASTDTTMAMLTPDYAAPEQLEGGHITTATDIYALGAVLFQLLTGVSPWRRENVSVPTIVRRILQDDPPLPSRVVKDGAIPANVIGGDLDAIILKAMRRDPDARYRSVVELADDLRRYQALEPVQAREGSTRYMFGRFVRRNRVAVTASAAALAALLLGVTGILWQSHQTAIERDVARAEARRSESINRMLTVMLRDTATNVGEDATVKQMLDATAERLANSVDTSARSADLITTLFDLYVNLEDSAGADALIVQAMKRGIGATDPVATAQLKMRAASSAAALGRTDEMAPLLDAAESVFRADPARYRRELVEINLNRAQLFRRTGRLDQAIDLLVATLPDADAVFAESHRDLLTAYNNLLVYMAEANRLDAMPAIFSRADAVIERTGQKSSMQGLAIDQLKGVRLLKLDQPARAEPVFARVAAQRRAVFGRSAGLAVDLLQLGRAKLALGKFAEARAVLAEAWPMASEKLSPAAPPTLIIGAGLVEAMAETGDTHAADRVLAEINPVIQALPKEGLAHGIVARARAITLIRQGRLADAAKEVDRAERIFRAEGSAGDSYLKGFPGLRQRLVLGGQSSSG